VIGILTLDWSALMTDWCLMIDERSSPGSCGCCSDDAYFLLELLHETLQSLMTNVRQALTGHRLKTVGQM